VHRLALSQGLDLGDPLGQLVDQADRWLKSREGRDTVANVAGTLFDRVLDRISIPRRQQLPPGPRRPRAAPPPPKPDPVQAARVLLHFGPDEPLTREKIKRNQKAVASLCHPDKGGSVEAMQRVNQAADILCNTLP
jgi:hypothetical protein